MSRLLLLFFLYAIPASGFAETRSESYDLLSERFFVNSSDVGLSKIFDGSDAMPLGNCPVYAVANIDLSSIVIPPVNKFTAIPVPFPAVVTRASSELISNERKELTKASAYSLDAWQQNRVNSALALLAGTPTGNKLAKLQKDLGVEFLWNPAVSRNAEAPQPDDVGGRKIIYLASYNLDELMVENPAFLAVVLAHELSHHEDYKEGKIKPESTSHLYTELKGFSSEVYVYDELLKAGKVPQPNQSEENLDLRTTRLLLAVRNYVNGGEKPRAEDFRFLGVMFDVYMKEWVDLGKKGPMSLVRAVKSVYSDLVDTPEEIVSPGPFAIISDREAYRNYKMAKNIKNNLSIATGEYIQWRNSFNSGQNVGQSPAQPQIPPQNPAHGGNSSGSSGSGGVVPPLPFIPNPHF